MEAICHGMAAARAARCLLVLALVIGSLAGAGAAEMGILEDAHALQLTPGCSRAPVPANPHLSMQTTSRCEADREELHQQHVASVCELEQVRLAAAGDEASKEVRAESHVNVVPPPLTTRAVQNLHITSDLRTWVGLGVGIASRF